MKIVMLLTWLAGLKPCAGKVECPADTTRLEFESCAKHTRPFQQSTLVLCANGRCARIWVTLTSLTLLALPAAPVLYAQTPRNADTAQTLTPRYKVGDTTRYKLVVHLTTPRPKMSELDVNDSLLTLVMREAVKEAAPDGTATLLDTTQTAVGDFDGKEVELTGAMPKVTQTRDKKGLVTLKLEGGIEIVRGLIAQLFDLVARTQRTLQPSAPVHVGETWKYEWQDSGDVEGKTQGTGTLVGPGMVDMQPTLKLKMEYTSSLKAPDPRKEGKTAYTLHFTGTADVDAKTFQPLRLQGTGDGQREDGATSKTELTFTRLNGKADKKEEKKKPTTGNTEDTGKAK